MLHQLIINVGVRGRDDDQIGIRNRFLRKFRQAGHLQFLFPEGADPGIIEANASARMDQVLDQADRRALPVIINVMLVGDTEHEHLRAVDRLTVLIEDAHRPLQAVFRHPIIDAHGSFDHCRMKVILARLPG